MALRRVNNNSVYSKDNNYEIKKRTVHGALFDFELQNSRIAELVRNIRIYPFPIRVFRRS